MVKRLPEMRETWVRSQCWEDLLEKEMATHSIILPGESQGRSSLVGCHLWGRTDSDTTEATQQQQQQQHAPTSNAEVAEVERFCEDLQDLLELTPKTDVLFIIGDWNAKVGS